MIMKITGKELLFNGNKIYHAGNKPTASEIGASPSSHNHDTVYLKQTATASSAAKLATARMINGVPFDGTSNINISASIPSDMTNVNSIKFAGTFGPVISNAGGYNCLTISTEDMEISGGYKLTVRQDVLDTLEIDATEIRGTQLRINGSMYGTGNICLDEDTLYLVQAGGNTNAEFLRMSNNLIACDDYSNIFFAKLTGEAACLNADSIVVRAFGNGGTTLMHNSLDGNGKNLGWSGSKFNQLSAKAVYGDLGSVSDINAKENIRPIQTKESLLTRSIQEIINENPETLDLDTNITMEEMFNFIKDELQLYQYNYKHEEKYEIEGAFNEKIGFIANEVVDSKVGKRFVAEHEGELAYNLNNFVFILAAALQEEIKKREALETQMRTSY